METDFSSIGRNIRKYRLSRKMRQSDLAEASGLSGNYIGMVERGEKIPSLESFIAITNALRISSDQLLSGVLGTGFQVVETQLSKKLEQIAPESRKQIYDVIETMLKNAKPIR